MKMDIDQDLQDALEKLKNDGVEIQIVEPGKGDQKIIIETIHYTVRSGANDIGVWLEEYKDKKR